MNFPKKVMHYFKLITFSALLVVAITFCPPLGGGKGFPSTIIISLGLSLPTAVVWAAFSCHGAKGEWNAELGTLLFENAQSLFTLDRSDGAQ